MVRSDIQFTAPYKTGRSRDNFTQSDVLNAFVPKILLELAQ
jgi:hypothetical protein